MTEAEYEQAQADHTHSIQTAQETYAVRYQSHLHRLLPSLYVKGHLEVDQTEQETVPSEC